MQLYYQLQYFLLFILSIHKCFAQYCGTPLQLITTSQTGISLNDILPSQYKIFTQTQLGSLSGMTRYSFSFWFRPRYLTNYDQFTVFRLTTDSSDDTPLTINGVRLAFFFTTDPSNPYYLKIAYAKGATPMFQIQEQFNYQISYWIFVYMGLDTETGDISYMFWQPRQYPMMILYSADVSEQPEFNSPLNANTQIELMYWGTYKRFNGDIMNFYFYPNFLELDTKHNMFNLAFMSPTSTKTEIARYRLEDQTGTSAINDKGGNTGTVTGATWITIGAQFGTGNYISIPKFSFSNVNNAWGISFWTKINCAVNVDADTTDAQFDGVLFSRVNGGSFRFMVLFYQILTSYSIKLRINAAVFPMDTVFQFAQNTWMYFNIRIAYQNAVTELTNIIFDVLIGNKAGSYHQMINQVTNYVETAGDVIRIGASNNDLIGTFQVSHFAIFSGYVAYQDTINLAKCVNDTQISNNVLGTMDSSLCANSKFLLTGQCLQNCPVGPYGVHNSLLMVCQTCTQTCSSCDATNQCNACKSGNYLNNVTKTCGLALACPTSPSLHVGNSLTWQCTQCGNGLVDSGEQCDDGNFVINDGCSLCTVDQGYICSTANPNVCVLRCGNGKRESGEECDDQNYVTFDGCSNCAIDVGYQCTGGSVNSKDTCVKICGNGVRDGSEICDDGNQVLGDGCSNCKVDKGWVCLYGTAATPDVCTKLCGNAKRDFGEECDDGNSNSGDGCSDCAIDQGYYCQNGSPTTPDTCTKSCGNGVRDFGEYCDDNNQVLYDGCSNCQIDNDYTCVGGSSTSKDVCTQLPSVCGDGKKKSTEQCDDSNSISGDGCSQTCMIEAGYICKGGSVNTRDICHEICGDGKKVGKEQCDDGNIYGGDGCNEYCQVELNYQCTGGNSTTKDVCQLQCGNGERDSNEECDDENQNSEDGCSPDCTIEVGYGCLLFAGTTRDTCFKCSQNCARCVNKTIEGCVYCQSGFYKLKSLLQNLCIEQCPSGYYPSQTTQSCVACYNPHCAKCLNSSQNGCTICDSESFYLNGECFSLCPTGNYFLRNIHDQSKQCTKCVFPCSACLNATICTDCENFYYLDDKYQCQSCGMGEQCTKCSADKSECRQCIEGFSVDGQHCAVIPDKCGDGLISLKEVCDDGNRDPGDGCSADCVIEENYGCIRVNLQGPSECYFKGPPKVSLKLSKAFDEIFFIKFSRPLNNNNYQNLKRLTKVKVIDYDRRKYNYTVKQKNLQTFEVSFEFADTIRQQSVEVNFTDPTQIVDKYNYSLPQDFQPVTSPLGYFIFYSQAEHETAESLGHISIYIQVIFLITMVQYIKYIGQGKCWKYIEMLQVIAAIKFLNLKFDLNSERIFQNLYYLTFNFVYNPFIRIPMEEQDYLNMEDDTPRLQKIQYESYFLQNSFGRFLTVFFLLIISKYIIIRLLQFGNGEFVQLTLEFLQKEYQYNIFIKAFDLIFLDLCIGVCFSLQNIYLNTYLSMINLGLAILMGIGLFYYVYLLIQRFVKNEGLGKNVPLYEAFNSLYDGIIIKSKYNRIFMVTPYIQKILMAGCLAFLQNIPIIQVSVYIFIRILPLLAIAIRNPFHFQFIRKREFISEGFPIVILGIIYKISDPNSLKEDLVMIGYILFVALIFFLGYFSYTNYWVVKQDDIEYYPPEQVVAPKVTEDQKLQLQQQKMDKIRAQRKQTKMTTQKLWAVDNNTGTVKTSEANLNLDPQQKEDIFEDQKQNLSTNRLTSRQKSNKQNMNINRINDNDMYEQEQPENNAKNKKNTKNIEEDEYEYEEEEDDKNKNEGQNDYFSKYAKDI